MTKVIKKVIPKNWLERMNDEYAFVLEGGDVRIFTKYMDPDFNCTRVQTIKPGAFKAAFDNQFVNIAAVDAKKAKYVSKGTHWYKHAGRRQYLKGTTLSAQGDAPDGYYNLWAGWGVEPAKGEWSLMMWHIKNIVCGGDRAAFDYLMGWMARAVQIPEVQGETAIVMRGKKGAGKGTLGNVLLDIFGGHSFHLTKSDQLVGRFNAHLRAAVLVFADEAFFAGDKKNEGSLKALITEKFVAIEPKGIDLVMGRNRTHIIMATNSDWAVPATADERRFLVVDVSDEKLGDTEYFKGLNTELDNGGKAAMLHDLLHYDISDFNVRVIPQTKGLLSQKVLSLSGVDAWLYDSLQNSVVQLSSGGNCDWDAQGVVLPKQTAYDAFTNKAAIYRCARDIPIKDMWSKRIRDIIGASGTRPNGVRSLKLPPLDESRERFAKHIGHDIEWTEQISAEGDDEGLGFQIVAPDRGGDSEDAA